VFRRLWWLVLRTSWMLSLDAFVDSTDPRLVFFNICFGHSRKKSCAALTPISCTALRGRFETETHYWTEKFY
jgi:hypothetical protein